MSKKEYVKTWKPFIAWLLGFPIMGIIAPNSSGVSVKVSTLIILLFMTIHLYLLMFIIYKGEYVYWFNGGPTYEEAKAAGSERRKKYAKAHLDLFGKMTLICFAYGLISLLFNFSTWIDIIIITGVIVVNTFATLPIKF